MICCSKCWYISAISVKLFVMSSWTIHCHYQNWGFFLWRASVEIWDYVKSLHLAIYTLAYVDNLYKPKLCRAWTQRKHFQNFRILKYILQSWIALLIFCKAFFCVKVLFERPCDLANYNFFFFKIENNTQTTALIFLYSLQFLKLYLKSYSSKGIIYWLVSCHIFYR